MLPLAAGGTAGYRTAAGGTRCAVLTRAPSGVGHLARWARRAADSVDADLVVRAVL